MSRALVIGGGIAGTVAAIALRAAGHDAVVHERRRSGGEEAGAYLTLSSNGMDALRCLGLDEAVRACGHDTASMAIYLGTGERLADLPLGGAIPYQTIKRADLYRVLRAEAAARGVPLHFGRQLVAAEHTVGGVLAHFADGGTDRGDLLVGADGLHSVTRRIIDPLAPEPTYSGMLATAGYTRGVPVPGRPGSVHMIYGKRSFFGYYPHPDGEVWWFANPPAPVREDGDRLRATPVAEWRRRVADLFRLDESPARALVLGAEEVFPGWHTYHLPTVPVWHRGRMIVIGDAVHAVTAAGQGAAMAMEDAVALAKCLRDIEDVPTAFGVFEDVRRKRVERIVAEGLRNGGDKTAGRSARMLRDERLRRAFRELAASGEDPLRPLWDHHIEWDERVRG